MMKPSMARLVIVSGAPGAGKTTLARRLAAELAMPLIVRDDIKEALMGSRTVPTPPARARAEPVGLRDLEIPW
jgi:adenylate kinase family enzyme